MKTILEKLLLEVKFEIPYGAEAVEITEDFVLGKAPPVFYLREEEEEEGGSGKKKGGSRKVSFLSRANSYSNNNNNNNNAYNRPVQFTEFEQKVVEELEQCL